MNRSLAILLLILSVDMGVLAQAPAVSSAEGQLPPPKAPYLKIPPPGSQWSVTISYQYDKSPAGENLEKKEEGDSATESATASGSEDSAGVPVRQDIQIGSDQIGKVTVTYGNGEKREHYLVKNQVLQQYSDSDRIGFQAAPYPWLGLEWLAGGAGEYDGTFTIRDTVCYRFKASRRWLASNLFPADTVYFALIRTTDGFPVQAQTDEVHYRYSPVTPFDGRIALPPAYQKVVETIAKKQRAIEVLMKMNGTSSR